MRNRGFRVNQNDINTNGSRLQGHLDITFQELNIILGKPILSNSDKTKAEWRIEGEVNGKLVIATIYDWKTNKNPEYVTDWHIGGYNDLSVSLIRKMFPDTRVSRSRF
jgi:hypothetical protein